MPIFFGLAARALRQEAVLSKAILKFKPKKNFQKHKKALAIYTF